MNLLNEHYWEHRAKVTEVALEGIFAALIDLNTRLDNSNSVIPKLREVQATWQQTLSELEAVRPPHVELPSTMLDAINRAAGLTTPPPAAAEEPKKELEGVTLVQAQAMLARHLSDQYIEDGDPTGFLPVPAYATPVGNNIAMLEPHGTVTKMWLQHGDVVTLTVQAGANGIAYSPEQMMFRLGVDNWQVWDAETVVHLDLDQAEIDLIYFIDTFEAGMERTGGG